MNSYEVRFNRSTFPAATLEEAEAQAMDLIDAACPFEAKIVEVDEDGEFVRTVKTLALPTLANMDATEYRKLRDKLGLTQAGLAARLGVTRETITRRETGAATITEEAALAIRALAAGR